MNILPEKPSDLIELALLDLALVERDKQYVVNMDDWHRPVGEYCSVCLAGSVIAKSLGAVPDRESYPAKFSPYVEDRLWALEYFRVGKVKFAVDRMSGYAHSFRIGLGHEHIEMVPYADDPVTFKHRLYRIAQLLRNDYDL
jgi:hypothetical protein